MQGSRQNFRTTEKERPGRKILCHLKQAGIHILAREDYPRRREIVQSDTMKHICIQYILVPLSNLFWNITFVKLSPKLEPRLSQFLNFRRTFLQGLLEYSYSYSFPPPPPPPPSTTTSITPISLTPPFFSAHHSRIQRPTLPIHPSTPPLPRDSRQSRRLARRSLRMLPRALRQPPHPRRGRMDQPGRARRLLRRSL